ncbi:hypothetical protein [Emticicia fluvialis]|uniref:hypothetical protein n=1 Tax=Emticicia fluvialis TaxID=2974474 RepID=UPI002166AE2F|nr:hypothetical protein [Emticicia fluvialis]
MIQIKRTNLDELAELHYCGIQQNVTTKLNKYTDVAKFLLNNISLKEIILGKPLILEEITNLFDKNRISQYKAELETIFDYKGFYKWRNYNAYTLAQNLQVNVCPYCNRQYTFTIINKALSKGSTRPEFDHFLSKGQYPYLALSFYNLIPSCKICNSSFKRSKEWTSKTHIHPYEEGFGNKCKFSLRLEKQKGIDFFYGKENSFSIILRNKGGEKIQNNINDLCLEPIYNGHKDYVREIIQKSIAYSESYVCELFNQYEGTLFSSPSDVQKMILNNYIDEEDLDKRVLSKLAKDISEELGLF